MADRAISALPTATTLTASDLFVLSQSNQAKNTTWQTIIGYLATALDGHGGINSITYTAPVPPSLAGTMTITLADSTVKTISVYNGNGVNGVVQHWAVSSSDSTTPSTWYVTKQTMTPTDRYLWNYMTMEMDDGNDIDTPPCVVGVYGDTGQAWYMWIRYSGSQPTSDADMGTTPDDWIGIYSGTESDPNNLHYTDYTWFKYKGEKGDTGAAASVTNQSVTYQESSSGTVVPSGSWTSTIPSVTQGNYLWTRTVLTYNSGTIVTSYSVARFGVDGAGSVASVNNQSPDGNGNVSIDASDIPMSDNQSVEAHINTLHKYMTVIGDAAFEEEEYDSQIGALVQWYGFTPDSGDNEIDIKDGDLILINFPVAHPWITANPTRVGIVTTTGYIYYLISGSEVTGTGEYQTHFAFRFNGTYLIPVDINGMTEKLDELKTNIIQSAAYAVTGNGTTSHSLTGLTSDHVVGNWGMYSDSGLTTPIQENAPTCDIEITTASGSWSITIANFTASFYIAPTFIKD